MTNMRQRRQIFEPIVARNPDTVLIGRRDLWVKPVRHVALRVLMETTYEADFTNLEWNACETFRPYRDLIRRIGPYGFHYMRDPPATDPVSKRGWQWSDPTMIPHLVATIETEALPFLRSLDTFERYVAYYRSVYTGPHNERQEDSLVVDIALGNLDAAQATYRALMPRYQKAWDRPDYRAVRSNLLELAEPLMAGDRPALAAMLHGWEAANIRGTVLERHWEPTPFPLETAAAS